MMVKCATVNIPMRGGKGGIIVDSKNCQKVNWKECRVNMSIKFGARSDRQRCAGSGYVHYPQNYGLDARPV